MIRTFRGRLVVSFLLSVWFFGPRARAAQSPSAHPSSSPSVASAPLIVPAGAIVPLEIKNTINSRTAYVGEAIYSETIYPVTEGDRILIPAHSFVRGSVTDLVRPGLVKGKAQLSLRFDTITLPDGTTRPLRAAVYSLAGCRLSNSKTGEESAEQADGEGMAAGGVSGRHNRCQRSGRR